MAASHRCTGHAALVSPCPLQRLQHPKPTSSLLPSSCMVLLLGVLQLLLSSSKAQAHTCPVQVDLKWDFSHPLGATPASTLQRQARWNLCSVSGGNQTCLHAVDQPFRNLSGSQSLTVAGGLGSGPWSLDIKGDTFLKVAGAVRSSSAVEHAAYYVKNYIALVSVLAEMEQEERLLLPVSYYGNMSLFSYINATLFANSTNATANTLKLQQLIDSSCACGSNLNTSSGSPFLNSSFAPLRLSADPRDPALGLFKMPKDVQEYQASYCQGQIPGGPQSTSSSTASWSDAACTSSLDELSAWSALMLRRLQNLTLDWRLGDGIRSGKIAARNTAVNTFRSFMIEHAEELYNPVFTAPMGVTPNGTGALTARLDVLQSYYLLSPLFYWTPMPASSSISRGTVYGPHITTLALAALSSARLLEIRALRNATLYIPLPPSSPLYPPTTLLALLSSFISAGAFNPFQYGELQLLNLTLPDMNSSSLGALRTDYNLVAWGGNTTAYEQCDLYSRAPQYLGVCIAMQQECTVSNLDTTPYNCTSGSGSTVPYPASLSYSLANLGYRVQCELPCNKYYDCSAVCECWGACNSNEVCQCSACQALRPDAAEDPTFIEIQAAANMSAAAIAAAIAPLIPHRRRRLHQTADLVQVLTQLSTVQQQLSLLQVEMASMASRSINLTAALSLMDVKYDAIIHAISELEQQGGSNKQAILGSLATLVKEQNQSLAALEQTQASLAALEEQQLQLILGGRPSAAPSPPTSTASSRHSKLQTQDVELSAILGMLSQVLAQQSSLQSQMSSLQSSVDRSNALIQARVNDDSLMNLISQLRADTYNNQQVIASTLDQTLESQEQLLSEEEQTMAAVSSIQSLLSQQLLQQQAQHELDVAVARQVQALKTAVKAKVINLTQALALWKKVRRSQVVTTKDVVLATTPCTVQPVTHHRFTSDNNTCL